MSKCHICKTEITDENKWVEGLCNTCVQKIRSNRYTVVVCNKHSLPQSLFLSSNKKPYPEYIFIDVCNFEIVNDEFED